MGLRDITLPTKSIQVPNGGGSFAVRGLSLDDIVDLAARHGPAAAMLYQQYIADTTEALAPEKLGRVLLGIKQTAPQLIGEVIAWAADDRGVAEIAAKLPIETQVEAIEAIVGLTFTSAESLGNVVAAVTKGMQGTASAVVGLTKVRTP